VSQPGDAFEREAEGIAARVMSGESASVTAGAARRHVQRAARGTRGGAVAAAPAALAAGLRSHSRPLDPGTRAFMESRFGREFGGVRVHAGQDAGDSAQRIRARAYTLGGHVVFAPGEYAPGTQAGRRLIAHELAHVVQQSGDDAAAVPAGIVPRVPTIDVLDENVVGPAAATQRRAARSCPIFCCSHNLGTLHAMPLFHHVSRGAHVAAGSAAATGIGAALHFIANPTQPAATDVCHCDSFRMIQILTTSPGHEADPRGRSNFVDNSNTNTPFYGDVGRSGTGEHAVPAGYTDAGERVTTTESIYDRPYRPTAALGRTSLSWMAETCVACIKNTAPDRILGGVTYGFTKQFDAARGDYDPVVAVAPACLPHATANFINTLSTDPTTSAYDFRREPGPVACGEAGDFPLPPPGVAIA
jgi:hypothetical protein